MPRMSFEPLPLERLYLAHELTEPSFGDTSDDLFYVRRADGKRSIVRQRLASGLAEIVTAEPRPAGGVGYGGAVYTVRGSTLVYAGSDGRLHAIDLACGAQRAITPVYEGVAAPTISPCGRAVAFLAEQDGHCNVLLADLKGDAGPIRLTDNPWYAFNPAFAPDGSRIAWQEWDQLDMPWDQSRIRIVRFARAIPACTTLFEVAPLTPVATIAKENASYAAPQWSPDGSRFSFQSDASGWRSLWIGDADGRGAARVDTGEGEIGLADWLPGRAGFRWSDDGKAIYAVRSRRSQDSLLRIDPSAGKVEEIQSGYTDIQGLQVRGHSLAYSATSYSTPAVIVTRRADGARPGGEVVRASAAVGLVDAASLAKPEVISWETAGGARSWGIYVPPAGPDAARTPRPLIVFVHGGPTSQVPLSWQAQAQYFATRGWHYLMVNHRGGTGYGRAYQDQLRGGWGVVDLEDARSGAEHVLKSHGADRSRVAITGGSAGGYSTLWALTQQPDFWTAGIALFPLAHIYDAVVGAHRFERHYEEGLFGRLPEAGPLWQERSPITHVDRVRAPLLLFHGTEDKAVPCQQSVDFAEAMRRRGATVELVTYEGEGHGFAKEANRRDMIERMERFLDKYVLTLQR
jgi:dipeptidyl aminopeptidase/acylaminoacyl peptidase